LRNHRVVHDCIDSVHQLRFAPLRTEPEHKRRHPRESFFIEWPDVGKLNRVGSSVRHKELERIGCAQRSAVIRGGTSFEMRTGMSRDRFRSFWPKKARQSTTIKAASQGSKKSHQRDGNGPAQFDGSQDRVPETGGRGSRSCSRQDGCALHGSSHPATRNDGQRPLSTSGSYS